MRSNGASLAAAATLAVGIPFVAFTNLLLFHFYVRGSFVLDTGLLASLIWHTDLALTQPASTGGGSYFATHVSPLFWLLSAISRMLPLSMPQFFAVFIGLSHALLALPVFWLLVQGFRLRDGVGPWIAALLAIGFAFSGLSLAIVRYPHFETLIPAFFLLFAAAKVFGRSRLALCFFVLGLATREDAGFHYAALLVLLVAWRRVRGVSLRQQRADCAWALSALLYAVAAMAIQRFLFPGTSAFTRVYLGVPPLAHLTTDLLVERLHALVVGRPYVVYPMLGAALWALLARQALIVLGFVASLPWLLIHLMAKAPLAGTLASYYAFPFLLALGWPLVAAMGTGGARPAEFRIPVSAFAGLLLLSFIPAIGLHDPGRLPLPAAFVSPPTYARQTSTDGAVAALSAARPTLGRLFVGNGIAALAPNAFTRDEVPFLEGDGNDAPGAQPDTVAFLSDGYDAERLSKIARSEALNVHYIVPGTSILIMTRSVLPTGSPLAEWVTRAQS